jgi:hypothetical protein
MATQLHAGVNPINDVLGDQHMAYAIKTARRLRPPAVCG